MTEASLLHRGCYGLHATTGGCKPGALPVAAGWRCPRRLHRRCAAFACPPTTVRRAGRLPTLPGKRSAHWSERLRALAVTCDTGATCDVQVRYAVPPGVNIREHWGSRETFVHYGPPKSPASPNPPRKNEDVRAGNRSVRPVTTRRSRSSANSRTLRPSLPCSNAPVTATRATAAIPTPGRPPARYWWPARPPRTRTRSPATIALPASLPPRAAAPH